MKQYARYNQGAWHHVPKPEWKRIDDRNSRYAKELSAQALCRGHAPRASVREMVQQIKNPLRELPEASAAVGHQHHVIAVHHLRLRHVAQQPLELD